MFKLKIYNLIEQKWKQIPKQSEFYDHYQIFYKLHQPFNWRVYV